VGSGSLSVGSEKQESARVLSSSSSFSGKSKGIILGGERGKGKREDVFIAEGKKDRLICSRLSLRKREKRDVTLLVQIEERGDRKGSSDIVLRHAGEFLYLWKKSRETGHRREGINIKGRGEVELQRSSWRAGSSPLGEPLGLWSLGRRKREEKGGGISRRGEETSLCQSRRKGTPIIFSGIDRGREKRERPPRQV